MSEAAVEVVEEKEDRIKIIRDCTIAPRGEFVVVLIDKDVDELTVGGIIIPESSLQNRKTVIAVVKAVGPGRYDYNNWDDEKKEYRRIPVECKVGDRVLCAAFIGYPVVINGVEHALIKHNDIMGNYSEVVEMMTVDEVRKLDLMTNDRIRVL